MTHSTLLPFCSPSPSSRTIFSRGTAETTLFTGDASSLKVRLSRRMLWLAVLISPVEFLFKILTTDDAFLSVLAYKLTAMVSEEMSREVAVTSD